MKEIVGVAILLGSGAVMASPALGDVWAYRAGLWAEDYTSDSASVPPSTKFCISADRVTLVMPAPDQPLRYNSETCKEITIAQTQADREVEDICGPNGIVRERHHIVLVGNERGVDRVETAEGPAEKLLTKKLRWIGADCGSAPSRSGQSILAR
jgi:hypothetical protein